MGITRKYAAAAGLSTAMIGGGIAGAVIFTPGLATAAQPDESTDTAVDPAGSVEREGPLRRHLRGRAHRAMHLDDVAEVLGTSPEELRQELVGGTTLGELAETAGVADDELVEVMTAEVEAHLAAHVADGDITQEQADERIERVRERARAVIEGEARGRLHRRGPGPSAQRGDVAEIAEVLGVTMEDLREAKAAGRSIADLAEANDVALEEVVAVIVDDLESRLDSRVASGDLGQEEAERKLEAVTERVTDRLEANR